MGEWYPSLGGLVVPRLLRPSRGLGSKGLVLGVSVDWCLSTFFFNAALLRRLLDIFPPKCLSR